MKSKRVGIDLGTTYSSIAFLDSDDQPTAIPDADGDFATPSVVYFPEGGKRPIVGRRAAPWGLKKPHRFVEHSKRWLGDPHAAWTVDDVDYTPVDIAAIILRKLIEDAEKEIGEIEEAVITVPAHFSGHQRSLTIEAGRQAGLSKVNIVNEPVAAALAFVLADYALGEQATILLDHLEEESTILVYDLGGGTFDLSIVRYDRTMLRAIATSGEQQLGGIDWDDQLIEMVIEPLSKYRSALQEPTLGRLKQGAERCKRALSNTEMTTIAVAQDGWEDEFELTRPEFEQRSAELVRRTRHLTEQLLQQCGVGWNEIDALVPVGGATRMPMIQRLLQSFAERRTGGPGNFIRAISPDLSVATGASLFAGIIRAGEEGGATASRLARTLANYRTQNVSAQALGILLKEGSGQFINHVLIPRNESLPATATVTVCTSSNNQTRASVKVVEGESTVDRVVCKCTINDLPPGLPSGSKLDVNVTYDADGLLHVVASHRDTGRLATVSTLFTAD